MKQWSEWRYTSGLRCVGGSERDVRSTLYRCYKRTCRFPGVARVQMFDERVVGGLEPRVVAKSVARWHCVIVAIVLINTRAFPNKLADGGKKKKAGSGLGGSVGVCSDDLVDFPQTKDLPSDLRPWSKSGSVVASTCPAAVSAKTRDGGCGRVTLVGLDAAATNST